MPIMEGEEVLTRLKEIDPEVRAIICSSNVQSSKQKELVDLGAKDYLIKPAKADILMAAINKALSA
jgi:two-component system chemotaxis response regulator CheY